MRHDVKKFTIVYIECFIIILFMGGILPNILERVLDHFYNQPGIYQNSILVGGHAGKPLEILYRYKYIFNSILR